MDRSSTITIGGKEYELVLTTKAVREINKKFGDMEKLGEKMMETDDFDSTLTLIIWLITLLANQAILRYNYEHRDSPKELLTEDEVELLTVPVELSDYKDAIYEALQRGMQRNVISEESKEKN